MTEHEPCPYPEYDQVGATVNAVPATGAGATGLEREVWDVLYGIEDPEMPVSIVDLGLIYGVVVDGSAVTVEMTLTYSGCPARSMLFDEIESSVTAIPDVESATVELLWNPPWSIEFVTEAGKDDLREFGLSV